MKYVKLGRTGLDVSRICVGCMSFGVADRGTHAWTMGEDESRTVIRAAVEVGVTFFDTANVYSDGTSEEIVGRALKEYARRDEVVIATKVYFPTGDGPNRSGLSRKAIHQEVDHSLRRLGTDYIDLYQTHFWDAATPLEETLAALDDLVRVGKVRYLGASSLWSWQLTTAVLTQRQQGWSPFVSMQSYYNLLNREEERETFPAMAALGVAAMPWSPLARGKLTRDWDATTARSGSDHMQGGLYDEGSDRAIVEAVATIAAARDVSRAQVALAWVMRNPVVVSPIVGMTRLSHLEDALAALDLVLTDEEVAALESPYSPRAHLNSVFA